MEEFRKRVPMLNVKHQIFKSQLAYPVILRYINNFEWVVFGLKSAKRQRDDQ